MSHTVQSQIPAAARPLRQDLTAVAVLAFIVGILLRVGFPAAYGRIGLGADVAMGVNERADLDDEDDTFGR